MPKVYVTFEKVVKEINLPADNFTVQELLKQACVEFKVDSPDEVTLRSGTRPIKDTYKLQENSNINMGRIKVAQPEPSDEDDSYTYEYEEVTDDEEDYRPMDSSDDDDDDDSSSGKGGSD